MIKGLLITTLFISCLKAIDWSSLDSLVTKGRAHLYKPMQIAEILRIHRLKLEDIDPLSLETYRTKSKKWRDAVTSRLVGRNSTSSSKFAIRLPAGSLSTIKSFYYHEDYEVWRHFCRKAGKNASGSPTRYPGSGSENCCFKCTERNYQFARIHWRSLIQGG